MLEKETGFFFNIKYFEELVLGGDWDEVERYLSGFTKADDNRYSMKIFFEIRKQKYLEALDRHDRAKAADILVKDLKMFASFNEDLFKEITHLITFENFRENEQLSKYGDTKSARAVMFVELKKLIESNPFFRGKLQFPSLKNSRLNTLVTQSSLNWQHHMCKNPRPNPEVKSLLVDHVCSPPSSARVPSPVPPFMNILPKAGGFSQVGAHGVQPFHPQSVPTSLGWIASVPPVSHPTVCGSSIALPGPPNTVAHLNRPMSPPSDNATVNYHVSEQEHARKRPRPVGTSDEVVNTLQVANAVPTAHLPLAYPGIARNLYSPDELLPKSLAVTLDQGSSVMSMDFHPSQPALLLVGTSVGDIALWDIASRERLAYRKFKVWDLPSRTMLLQSTLDKNHAICVNRVAWSLDGSQFGVAYSKHLLHLYTCNGRDDLVHHLEIEAHVGGVNDLAFSQPNKQLVVITCGDDKTIKVWDATSGSVLFTFEGHEAPVYSICPRDKENVQFIFSTSLDGKIKAWLYENGGSKVDYTAPGHWCTTMAYSADGKRLFSCGTSKEGDTYIVEWDESEGSIKRTYNGFRKRSIGVVQFDMTNNRFLAAGDEFLVKFWDMDNATLLTTTDAEGGLPDSPRIRFNKRGSLLAVSTKDNSIKILANAEGLQLLRSLERRSYSATRSVFDAMTKNIMQPPTITPSMSVSATAGTSAAIADRDAPMASVVGLQNGDARSLVDVKPRVIDESIEISKPWKLTEIKEPSQCCSLRLPDSVVLAQVSRLIYTNSGTAILALASNAVHKLWRWQKTQRNTSAKATVSVPPQLWQPPNGILMTNEIGDANTEEACHCFALSKNDSYVMSASGGKVSLFNMMTFKTMTTLFEPPPTATSLAFHPQDNNVIAIGMDDSSIQIYNIRINEVKIKLRGHQKRITGLAFSCMLDVLISSGADAQLCIWAMEGWEKKASKFLQIPSGRVSGPLAETRVQFHNDQIHLLVVHELQLAVYEAAKLECLEQWVPRDGLITGAAYSCDGKMIYASFADGSVSVFTPALRLRCRINPTAYLNAQPSLNVYPLAIVAHPSEPNQFALGLTDGGVQVLEPLESEGKWGTTPPSESSVGGNSSTAVGYHGSDQPSR